MRRLVALATLALPLPGGGAMGLVGLGAGP